MAIDRSKYRSTTTAALVDSDKETDKKMGKSDNGRADFLTIDNGKNVFRIYPPHMNGGGVLFAEPKVVTFLPVYVEEKDDRGKMVKVLKQKNVFNGKVHGKLTKDLVDEYINFVKKLASDRNLTGDAYKEFLAPLYGVYSKDSAKRKQGITYRNTWTLYADKYEGDKVTFGRLEIGKSVKERLNKIAASTESSDDPAGVDPFTNPDDGRAIVITYNKDADKPQDYYTTELDNSTTKSQGMVLVKTYPLTDEQLEHLETFPSLVKLFHNVFTRRDFELQLDGLKNFDEANENYQVFSHDEWFNIIDSIDEQLPASEEEEEELEVDEKVDGDEFDLMTRAELKAYNVSEGFNVRITTSMSEDDIRGLIRSAIENSDSKETEVEEVDEVEEVEEKATSTASVPSIAQERLAALRKKANS